MVVREEEGMLVAGGSQQSKRCTPWALRERCWFPLAEALTSAVSEREKQVDGEQTPTFSTL